MLRWFGLIRQAGRPWMFLFALSLLLLGGLIVGNAGTRLISHQLAYHSYKEKGQALIIGERTKQKTKEPASFIQKDQRPKVNVFNSVTYPTVPKLGDELGQLDLPKLKVELPIVEGANPDQLAKGVGHFQQSVLPGEKDNCVLSGHRDTVFRQLGQLKIGDDLVVKTKAGTFDYRIKKIRIVDQSDRTVIVPTRVPTLTLTTCYPFHFIGNAPKRYIIIAHLQPAKSQVYVS